VPPKTEHRQFILVMVISITSHQIMSTFSRSGIITLFLYYCFQTHEDVMFKLKKRKKNKGMLCQTWS